MHTGWSLVQEWRAVWQREEHVEKLAKISGAERVDWSIKPERKWNSLGKGRVGGTSVWSYRTWKRVWMLKRSLWWMQRAREDCRWVPGSTSLGGRRVVNGEKRSGRCGGKYLQIRKEVRVGWLLESTFWESPRELRKFLKQLVQRDLRWGRYQGQRTEGQSSWGPGQGSLWIPDTGSGHQHKNMGWKKAGLEHMVEWEAIGPQAECTWILGTEQKALSLWRSIHKGMRGGGHELWMQEMSSTHILSQACQASDFSFSQCLGLLLLAFTGRNGSACSRSGWR